MENENKLISGICKLAGSAFNTAVSAKNDLSELIKHQVESYIRGMNFVTKGEFDALKSVVLDLRDEVRGGGSSPSADGGGEGGADDIDYEPIDDGMKDHKTAKVAKEKKIIKGNNRRRADRADEDVIRGESES